MPQTVRVSNFFSGKEQGWSESYIYPIPDSMTPKQAYDTIFQNLANLRAQLLGREYTLDFVRIAIIYDVAGNPVKRAVFLANPGYRPSLQTAVNSGEQPNACALLTFTDTTGKRVKKSFLGAPPDAVFTDAGVYVPTGASNWSSRFSAWSQAQFQASAGWLQDVPVNAGSAVDTITANPNLTKTYKTKDSIWQLSDFGQRRQVRIKGVNGKSVYNGAWVVIPSALDTFTTVDPFAAAPYVSGGFVTPYTFPKPVAVAQTITVNREGTHKRGRPIVATRGRLAARPKV